MLRIAVEIDLKIRLFEMWWRIKNHITDLKTDCAKRHGVFLNPHFLGFGFGAKSTDITVFSGLFSFPNLSLKTDLGRFLGIFKRIWGIFGRIWEVLKAREKVF